MVGAEDCGVISDAENNHAYREGEKQTYNELATASSPGYTEVQYRFEDTYALFVETIYHYCHFPSKSGDLIPGIQLSKPVMSSWHSDATQNTFFRSCKAQ
jgi:hypothetical protein